MTTTRRYSENVKDSKGYASALIELRQLEDKIKTGLQTMIVELQTEIDSTDYSVPAGAEDEFYLFGATANSFWNLHGYELQEKFPLIDRIYPEANALLLGGTKLRLGLPYMRKWEITTKHIDENGRPISIEEQSKLLNEIREYIIAHQREWSLIVDYSARPIPDVMAAIESRYLPYKITDVKLAASLPKQIRITDAEALRYLQNQIRKPEFGDNVHNYKIGELVNLVYRFLEQHPDKSALPFDDNLPKAIKEKILAGEEKNLMIACAEREELGQKVREKDEEIDKKIESLEDSIFEAESFKELCEKQVIINADVPGNGVDINTSVQKDGVNVMFDKDEPHKTSHVFWCIAAAYVDLIGKDTGSLLPSTQSYDPLTYLRMGQARLAASSQAAVTQSKADGGCLKRSPFVPSEYPDRVANDWRDIATESSLRLERREGEPGGALGTHNSLAQLHYCVTALLAHRNGLKMVGTDQAPKSWEEVLARKQKFNHSHGNALSSFASSELLMESYKSDLRTAIIRHAQLSIHINLRLVEEQGRGV